MSQELVTFYLVRHGETMLNIHDRLQGWSDAPLTPKGEVDTLSLAKEIKDSKIPFLACYSSDSGRAQQTAYIISSNIDQPHLDLKVDSRLREYSFGNLESEKASTVLKDVEKNLGQGSLLSGKKTMKGSDRFIEKIIEEVIKIDRSFPAFENKTWPAESFQEVTIRMRKALDDIREEAFKQGGGNILIVSHGLSIMSLVQHLDPLKEVPLEIKNGSFTRIIFEDNQYRVEEFAREGFYSK